MKLVKYNSQIEFFKNEEAFINSNEDEISIAVLDQTEVLYNKNSGCNVDYCEEHNIASYCGKIDNLGTGVIAQGSIVITVKKKISGGEALSDQFSKALVNYFTEKGLPSVRQDNNDVLVNDGKVASGGEIVINGFNYMGYQISINQDIETIDNVCTKPSVKTPAALSEYNITTEEMVKFCEDYWLNV